MLYNEKIAEALGMMDDDLLSHCMQTKSLASLVCKSLDLDRNILETAAVVHDIGKIYVPASIMRKPAGLNSIEREIIDLHAYIGYRILMELEIDSMICNVVLYHHGRDKPWIKPTPEITDDVKLYADALRTIDAYDALTSDRPFREKVTPEDAICELKKDGFGVPSVISILEQNKP